MSGGYGVGSFGGVHRRRRSGDIAQGFGLGARLVAACALASTLGACAGDLTSGGVGELEVVVVSDSLQVGPSLSLLETLTPYLETTASTHGGPHIIGNVTVWMQTYVRRGYRDWVEVTDGIQAVTLAIPGGAAQIAVRPNFPAGEYTHVRNRFYKIEVEVLQGLTVRGDTIEGIVTVYLGLTGRADVPRPVSLTLEADGTATLAIELRAARWLPLLDLRTRRVPLDEFLDALRVRRSPVPVDGGG